MNKDQEKNKDTFTNAWKKVSNFGKNTVEGAKNLAEQAKKSIHEQQAKKYIPVTAKEFKSKSFQAPKIIEIVDNSANSDFIDSSESIGWIEEHKEVEVFHLYSDFVKKSNLTFVPVAEQDNVYCADNFDSKKYINVNQIFGKATEEKLAELRNIAYCLGAKSCSIEIMESDVEITSRSIKSKSNDIKSETHSKSTNNKMQSGKTVSHFEGHDDPQIPELKWFAHDDNIKGLIEMRRNRAIKSNSLTLNGSSSSTMSRKIACAIDQILKINGSISMEKEIIKEHNKILIFEVEF